MAKAIRVFVAYIVGYLITAIGVFILPIIHFISAQLAIFSFNIDKSFSGAVFSGAFIASVIGAAIFMEMLPKISPEFLRRNVYVYAVILIILSVSYGIYAYYTDAGLAVSISLICGSIFAVFFGRHEAKEMEKKQKESA